MEKRAEGSSPEALMEKAGLQIARAINQFCPEPGVAQIFFGKGHNGGDALVAARHLRGAGWELELYPVYASDHWSELAARKYQQLGELEAPRLTLKRQRRIIVDGLLGLGVKGPLRQPIAEAAHVINQIRQSTDALVFAVDLPTGLDADSGECDPHAVVADYTLAVGAAKAGLVADSAIDHVGRLVVLQLDELGSEVGPAEVATPANLSPLLRRRVYDTHKGDYGRVGIVAGSVGLTGAALMCAHAAVRAGAGLVTLFVGPDIYPLIAQSAMPEVMVRPLEEIRQLLKQRHDALAIGPGLGFNVSNDVIDLMRGFSGSLVVDADALTVAGRHKDFMQRCSFPRLFTPHAGEIERLIPVEGLSRAEVVASFCQTYPGALLFKGARTVVGQRGMPLSYNSTGHPGMATGGMGDVLTGVCLALLGQKLSVYDAARVGAWVCGRAAERVLAEQSQESLSATDLLGSLGGAFDDLRGGCF